jgi:glycosyltransferase involved in cell wall biosynthesis
MHDCWSFRPKAFEWHNRLKGINEFLCEDRPHASAIDRRVRFFNERNDVVMVAPSRWIGEEAKSVLGSSIRIEHIPYGVCSRTFQPRDQSEARRRIGLDADKIWLGIAATHAYSRKGLDVFAKALQGIDPAGLGLLSWGQKPDLELPENLEVRVIGMVADEAEIASLYSACDVFVCPSRSDNLPNTVLESLACGTPVIGSDAGGIPDMVRPGETGWLFRSDHPDSCCAAITTALRERACWQAMKQRCREVAVTDYSLAAQARRYGELFDEFINLSPRCR